jgi:hypothetical protein
MTENQTTGKLKSTRERSAAYPSISLGEASEHSIKLQAAFSKSAFSRDNAANAMGYQKVSGPIGMKISSLVQYGLLVRDGNAYRNSDLALRFAHPIDDSDLQEAKKIAATNPKLYRTLLNEFAGRALPTALSSILVRNHKIGQKVADDVVNIFRKTIEYADLYQNGIVSNEFPATKEGLGETDTQPQPNIQLPQSPHTIVDKRVSGNPAPQSMLTVELPSGIVVSYPKNLGFVFAKIAALEETVQQEMKKHGSDDTTSTE